MNFQTDFEDTVRETIAALRAGGTKQDVVTCKGTDYTGWVVDVSYNDGSSIGEVWSGTTTTLLDDNGSFTQCKSETTRYPQSSSPDELVESVRTLDVRELAGRAGEPFSEWKRKLQYLPYR